MYLIAKTLLWRIDGYVMYMSFFQFLNAPFQVQSKFSHSYIPIFKAQ